jgi:hypothetical protein
LLTLLGELEESKDITQDFDKEFQEDYFSEYFWSSFLRDVFVVAKMTSMKIGQL